MQRVHAQNSNHERHTGQNESQEASVVDLADEPQGDVVLTFVGKHGAIVNAIRGSALVQVLDVGTVNGVDELVCVISRKRVPSCASLPGNHHAIKFTICSDVVTTDASAGEKSVDVAFDLGIKERELLRVPVVGQNGGDAPDQLNGEDAQQENDVDPGHATNLAAERDEAPDTEREDNNTRNGNSESCTVDSTVQNRRRIHCEFRDILGELGRNDCSRRRNHYIGESVDVMIGEPKTAKCHTETQKDDDDVKNPNQATGDHDCIFLLCLISQMTCYFDVNYFVNVC